MGHPSRRVENGSVGRHVGYGGRARVVSMGILFATGLKTSLAIFWQTIMADFSPCPKNLPKAKFKRNEISSLVEESPRQPNIDSLLDKFIMNKRKGNRKECKIYSLKKTGEQRNLRSQLRIVQKQ